MTQPVHTVDPIRFQAALDLFYKHNATDPNVELDNGHPCPRELLYAKRLTDWVLKLAPDASEELRLAARCQHICRWEIPRNTFPMTKAGYLQWRTKLKSFHAERAGEILRSVGYPAELVQRVQDLNLKKNFPNDPDSRILEDALCLVFLQYQFADLASKTADDKMINALQKSWKKMTEVARKQALELTYTEKQKSLLQAALTDNQ